jgi:sulfonate transport system substrate-binding protein
MGSSSRIERLVLFAVAAAIGGCSRSRPEDAPARTTLTSAQATESVVIRFSDPGNSGIFAYAKREKLLEAELAKVNASVAWVPAAGAFSANFEAMNSGAINASGGAISPIIGALSHNLQFKIYGISDPGGVRRAGVIAPGGSSVHTLEDLAGKRVAVNAAAHGDYVLLKALDNAGIPADRVTRVPIQPPDAAAAFSSGKIDGWSTFGVFFSTAVKNGAQVLALESDIGSDDVGILAANVAVLEKNPAAFQVVLKVSQALTAEAHAAPEKFQNVFTDKGPTAVAGDELRIAIEETRILPAYRVPTPSDRVRVGNVAKLFFVNKSIDRNIPADEVVFDVDAAAATRTAGAANTTR